jgi:hypothetical protein
MRERGRFKALARATWSGAFCAVPRAHCSSTRARYRIVGRAAGRYGSPARSDACLPSNEIISVRDTGTCGGPRNP